MQTITIRTRLDDRITGGGGTVVHHERAVGPRNLIRAVAELAAHRQRVVLNYGNVGCGRSWLCVGETEIDDNDIDGVVSDHPGTTPTSRARDLLAEIAVAS